MKKYTNSSETMQSNEGTISNNEISNATNSNDPKNAAGKIFSNADLWNIQRQRKMLTGRRYSF